MNNWWRNQPLKLKIILGILLFVILGLIVAIIIFGVINSTPPAPEEEPLTQFEIRSTAYEIYSEEGLEKVEEYYDNLEKNTRNQDEKKAFLYNKVIDYRSICGWDCRDRIVEMIHSLYDLAPEEAATKYDYLCYFEDIYVDADPIEPCKKPSEGYYNE